MKKMLGIIGMVAAFITLGMSGADARSIRATELNAKLWSQVDQGEIEDLVIEFRQGDEIPVMLRTEGDLLESKSSSPTYVGVKRSFWIRIQKEQFLLSLDGAQFKPIDQTLSGSFSVGASSDQSGGPANAINMLFEGYLK